MISAEQASKNWLAGVGNSRAKSEASIDAVTVAPGELAAAQSGKWRQKVSSQEAHDKFKRNSAAVPLSTWKQLMKSKGLTNAQAGASLGQKKFQAYAVKALPIIEAIKQEAAKMSTDTIDASLAKANFVAREMQKRLSGI
jgi:hypothetical protein